MVYRSWLNDVQAMAEGQGEPHDVSAVSLLKSGEQRYIKAIIFLLIAVIFSNSHL